MRQMLKSVKMPAVLTLLSLMSGGMLLSFGVTPAYADRIVVRGGISIGDGYSFSGGDRWGQRHRYGSYWDRRDRHTYIIDSDIDDSTLVNPVIIDSSIDDSTIINPVIINRSRYSRPSSRPGCLYLASMRAACQR
jgi:hypothetical protein